MKARNADCRRVPLLQVAMDTPTFEYLICIVFNEIIIQTDIMSIIQDRMT